MSYLVVKNLQTVAGATRQDVIRTWTTYTSSSVSNTTTTWVDTGLTQTLTPLSSSNKFLFIVDVPYSIGTNNTIQGAFGIYRDATLTYSEGSSNGLNINYYHNYRGASQINYVDSPASTSSITYKVKFRVPNNNGGYDQTMYVCYNGQIATMTIMEIAG